MSNSFDTISKSLHSFVIGGITMARRNNNIVGLDDSDRLLTANFGCEGDHLHHSLPIFKQVTDLFKCRRMDKRFNMRTSFYGIDPGTFDMQAQDTLTSLAPVSSYCINTFV